MRVNRLSPRMDNIDLEVLETAERWVREGHRTVLATVVQTWGSAPRPVGSIAAVRDDGHLAGSVSGGCIEDDLMRLAVERALPSDHPEIATYGVSADEAQRFGLPCGGTLRLVLEPLGAASGLAELLDAVASTHLINRELNLQTGQTRLLPGDPSGFVFDEQRLVTVHGSSYRMLIIGAGQMSQHLAAMAMPLGYRVTICDPREEYAAEWSVPGTTLSTDMPDDVVLSMQVDRRTAIVALTHDPKLDDLALIDALQSEAFYVGAIGSRANREKRCERLKLFDLNEAQLARMRCPVGLYLGAKTPAEIAMSILAEMTAVRYGVPVIQGHAMRSRHADNIALRRYTAENPY